MKRYIKSSKMMKSQCSFDFINDGNYNTRGIEKAVDRACEDCGVTLIAIDFRSVDYSMYPEYKDEIVGQCGFDFEWDSRYGYSAKDMRIALEDYVGKEGADIIGIDWTGLEEEL